MHQQPCFSLEWRTWAAEDVVGWWNRFFSGWCYTSQVLQLTLEQNHCPQGNWPNDLVLEREAQWNWFAVSVLKKIWKDTPKIIDLQQSQLSFFVPCFSWVSGTFPPLFSDFSFIKTPSSLKRWLIHWRQWQLLSSDLSGKQFRRQTWNWYVKRGTVFQMDFDLDILLAESILNLINQSFHIIEQNSKCYQVNIARTKNCWIHRNWMVLQKVWKI